MTGYMQKMRQAVGHDVVIQCGASVIVVNDRNEILLQKRRDCGQWGYHGGSVEIDEEVEETARRELLEETGLKAGKMTLLGVFSGPDMHWVYPNGDQVSNVDTVFVCRDYEGEARAQESEVTELKFFSVTALPQPLFPPNIKALNYFLEHQGV